MKIAMLCFSLTGWETGMCLKKKLENNGAEVILEGKSRYLSDSIEISTSDWAGLHFEKEDALVFIGASGIAVRSIAPYIQKKTKDPAVLVIDECGRFVISLLSGHLGGANELTLMSAELLEAVPVITTATDLHQRFAVDVFAKKNKCSIFNMKAAKAVSAALLAGEPVGFYSDFGWNGELPQGLMLCTGEEEQRPEVGVAVSVHRDCVPFHETVQLVPKVIVLGMGCKKGKESKDVFSAACECLEEEKIYEEAVVCVASIDLKKEEQGLLDLTGSWKVPFVTYSGEELLQVKGEFTASPFVKSITGVDNVCERSAVLGSGKGKLIRKKTGRNGVTTAVAISDWRMDFE